MMKYYGTPGTNKVALIFPVLESYDIVQRQIQWMNSLLLPDNWEVIFVDDGSVPPIEFEVEPIFQYQLIRTYDYRPWTQAKAVNIGVLRAKPSEYMWGLAIDHFISHENIQDVSNFEGDKMVFPRTFAVLGEDGIVRLDEDTLYEYGWEGKNRSTGGGPGIFVMKRSIWEELGGYDMSRFGEGGYGGDDVDINHRYGDLHREGKVQRHVVGRPMYVFPNPRYDKQEVFHSLRGRRK